ncbi:MAG TPA: hypothetical protein VF502_04335 [Stellaceae bacterium]
MKESASALRTPARISGIAAGSTTSHSTWRRLAPAASADQTST